jgi:hypothetical protein
MNIALSISYSVVGWIQPSTEKGKGPLSQKHFFAEEKFSEK